VILVDIDYEFLNKLTDTYAYFSLLLLSKNKSKESNELICRIKQQVKSIDVIRPSNDKVLWVAGCSVTAGSGVHASQRYGSLLAKELNLPIVLLAKPGASIFWAADNLLTADIREGDIVVWGLTTMSRVDITSNFKLESVPVSDYVRIAKNKQYWLLDYFDSQSQAVFCQRTILQVINYCRKIKAKLIIANILDSAWGPLVFGDEQNYIDLLVPFNFDTCRLDYADFGTDNEHPGPKQHELYATQILNFIKENNHG
jgi:hypothetical protein